MHAMADANGIQGYAGSYTNVTGGLLDPSGATTSNPKAAAAVGGGVIPPTAQGVRAGGDLDFDTTFARVLGINQFRVSADATAVSGALTGGQFLPVVFPVSMKNCDGSGNLVENLDAPWRMANPPKKPPVYPDGQEYLVPLCKTGGGAFMILDLDPDKNCYEEVVNPSSIQFNKFPVDVPVDNGNDCAKKVAQRDRRRAPAGQGRPDPDLRRRLLDERRQQRQVPRHPDRLVLPRLHLVRQQPEQLAVQAHDVARRTGPRWSTSSTATAARAAWPAGSCAT